MDYSKLSDFEINTAVFEAIHGGSPDYKEGDGGAMVLISYEGDVVDGDAVEVEVERGEFNPCNNPADAWPIIYKHKISIEYDGDNSTNQQTTWCHAQNMYRSCGINYQSNPLRAAMIVFLMMQDSENVPANSTGPDIR